MSTFTAQLTRRRLAAAAAATAALLAGASPAAAQIHSSESFGGTAAVRAAAVDAAGGSAAAHVRPQAGKAVPAAALASVSRILGRDDPAYHARETARGLTAANPRQRLRAQFTTGGVRIRSGPLVAALGLRGIGFADRLAAVRQVRPVAVGNLISFRHGQVQEWYANGPLGLEQRFNLTGPPPGRAGGPLTLALALSGNARAVMLPGRGGVVFSRAGRSLVYRGLVASDARGRRLPASLELRGRRLLLHVQTRGARYPLTVDPVIQQAQLTASDGAAGDSLGLSVAISASGNTIAAAAGAATVNGNPSQGAVYVFTRPPGGWHDATQAAKLTASDGAPSDFLGNNGTEGETGVAISANGNTVVAGASGNAPGAVYVFTKPKTGWHDETQATKLTGSDTGPDDNLGFSVGISGNVVVSGSPDATVNGNLGQGAVYMFIRPSGGWRDETQAAKLTASDGAVESFLGGVLAMSGRTVVTGGATTVNGNFQGAVYVFTEPPGGWRNQTQTAKLTSSSELPSDFYASSVAVSGSTVIVGATGVNQDQGAAYLFARPSGGWRDATQTAELTASGGSFLFGYSVTIVGRTAIAGGGLPGGANGAIWIFAEPPGGWQTQTQTAEISNPDFLGLAEALSRTTLAAGAVAPANGAVDVFVKPPGGWHNNIQMATSSQAATCPHLRWSESPTAPVLKPAPVTWARCR
jgi:trimeric autotransporter adhesin